MKYVIQVITKAGKKGYVFDSKDGLMVIVDGITAEVTIFDSFDEAKKFIRNHKLERKFKFAFAKDFQSLIDEKEKGLVSNLGEDLFYIENELGEKMCYDTKNQSTSFKNARSGFVAGWINKNW